MASYGDLFYNENEISCCLTIKRRETHYYSSARTQNQNLIDIFTVLPREMQQFHRGESNSNCEVRLASICKAIICYDAR